MRARAAFFAVLSFAVGLCARGEMPATAPTTHPIIRFIPLVVGKPKARVVGGTRGIDQSLPNVVALTPDETGFTNNPSPSLFWYISEPTKDPIEIKITLTRGTDPEPVLKLSLNGVAKPGFQRVDLSKLHVVLKKNEVYRFIVMVGKPGAPGSESLCSAGMVQCIDAPADLKIDPADSDFIGRAATYATRGLFYDSLMALQDGLDSSPDDSSLQSARDSLLHQVGFVESNGEIYDSTTSSESN